jgi:hypothetical protein
MSARADWMADEPTATMFSLTFESREQANTAVKALRLPAEFRDQVLEGKCSCCDETVYTLHPAATVPRSEIKTAWWTLRQRLARSGFSPDHLLGDVLVVFDPDDPDSDTEVVEVDAGEPRPPNRHERRRRTRRKRR